MNKFRFRVYILPLLLLIAAVSCRTIREEGPPVPEIIPVEIPAPPEPSVLTLIAAGDNLFHDVMIRPPPAGEAYNFEPYYSEIKHLIQAADLAFINQETLLAGSSFGFSGYPRFNTPQELGAALAGTGFDIVNHANNHVMDKGENAVLKTMDYWDTVPGIRRLGIHRSQEERDKPVIIEKNGIRLGFLAYTYGTNGLPVPRDKPFMVSLIDEKIMAEEIEALRPLCDYLVVSMHWGEEYTHVPNGAQRKAAEFLAARDVDLILGHHPHVIQPFESIPRPDGGTTLCYYSLGNFISGQTRNPTLLGALASVTIKKTDGMITVEEAGAIPVVTHYENGFTGFRVYPLAAYTAELAGKHWARMMGSEVSIPYFSELAKKIFPERILNKSPAAK